MIGRCVGQDQPEKLTQRKRVGGPPRDRALRVQALEIADQQQPEVATGRQPRTPIVRVESLADPFNVGVEAVLVEDLIQSRVERMRSTARNLGSPPTSMPVSHAVAVCQSRSRS